MIKAVLIDVDNTLLDFDECSKFAMNKSFEKMDYPVPENLFEVFKLVNTELWEQVQRTEIDLETLYKTRWNIIFRKLNISLDGVEFEGDFLNFLSISTTAVNGACEILEYLSGKYIVSIASNAPYDQQIKRLEKAGMLKYFQHIFISEKIGFEKPSSNFFEFCLNELQGINPDEIMMIGDSVSADIAGAKGVGMQTCWYNHNKIQPHAKVYDIADFIIDDLVAIKNIV